MVIFHDIESFVLLKLRAFDVAWEFHVSNCCCLKCLPLNWNVCGEVVISYERYIGKMEFKKIFNTIWIGSRVHFMELDHSKESRAESQNS